MSDPTPIDDTFRDDAQLGYTFKRPPKDAWDAALAAAAEVITASNADD